MRELHVDRMTAFTAAEPQPVYAGEGVTVTGNAAGQVAVTETLFTDKGAEVVLAQRWSASLSVTTQDGLVSRPVTAENIRPRPQRLLIRRVRKNEKTAGGIVLPETTQAISQMGEVVAAGEGTTLHADDLVIFSVYAALPCVATSDSGDELLFVREADILAVVVAD